MNEDELRELIADATATGVHQAVAGILNALGIIACFFALGWLAIWAWDNPQRALNRVVDTFASSIDAHPNVTAAIVLIPICIALWWGTATIQYAWLNRRARRKNKETLL